LKLEKSLVSRAVEELYHAKEDSPTSDATSTVATNPISPRPPPGTKAATAHAGNHQQHASSSQTSVFVVTIEHVKILVGMILAMLFTVKFLNNGNVNGPAEL